MHGFTPHIVVVSVWFKSCRIERPGTFPKTSLPTRMKKNPRFFAFRSGFWRWKRSMRSAGAGKARPSRPFRGGSSPGVDMCITTTIRTSLIACATTSKPRVVFVLDLPLDTAIATLRLCVWLAKPMLDFVATARAGIDTALALDATCVRVALTAPTVRNALAEIAAMVVEERTVGVIRVRATKIGERRKVRGERNARSLRNDVSRFRATTRVTSASFRSGSHRRAGRLPARRCWKFV
jgi:hypothetical protein